MLDFEIIVESGQGYIRHYPDDEEAIQLAEKSKSMVAFY